MSSSSAAGTLPLEDYQRYGRQMILNGFGLPGRSHTTHACTIFTTSMF